MATSRTLWISFMSASFGRFWLSVCIPVSGFNSKLSSSSLTWFGTVKVWNNQKVLMWLSYPQTDEPNYWPWRQRYTYRVLQTIKMKLILLFAWAEPAFLGSAKTALKFKYEI